MTLKTVLPILLLVTSSIGAHGQVGSERYNQLMLAISTAPDKISAAQELVQETETSFQPKDVGYFNGYLTAGMQVAVVSPRVAISYLEKAIKSFHENEATLKKVFFDDAGITHAYVSLIQAYNLLGLASTGAQILESKKTFFDGATNNGKATFYNLLGDQYFALGERARARAAFDVTRDIMASNLPMLTADKKDPRWKKDLVDNLDKVYRDSRLMALNNSLGDYYYQAGQYDSAVLHMRAASQGQQSLAEMTEGFTKVSKFAKMLLPDTMKTMVKENADYRVVARELYGENQKLVIALYKSGSVEEARAEATTLRDRAHFHHLSRELDQSEALYREAFARAREFSTWRYYKWAAPHFMEMLTAPYNYLQAARKNYPQALKAFADEIGKADASLQRDFSYFSENEKREYFAGYAQKLQRYYSLLLAMGDNDPSARWEILNKSIQVKGLILEATKAQHARLRSVNDPGLNADIQRIVALRESLSAFTQMAKTSAFPVDDSIAHYTLTINRLQQKVNDRIGNPDRLLGSYTWRDIQQKLAPADAYVEVIAISRDNFFYAAPVVEYWVFVVRSSGTPTVTRLGEGDVFEKGLRNYHNNIRFKLDDGNSFGTFWKPISELVRGVTKVYFNGDGVYHTLNLLTLKNPETNRFLMDDISLVTVSAGRDLLKTKDEVANTAGIVLIGNPDFTMDRKSSNVQSRPTKLDLGAVSGTRAGFNLLPGTEREVTAIASLAEAKGFTATMFKGSEASEPNVKKIMSPALLHFATHGLFDDYGKGDSYLKSKLILAGAGDGKAFTLDDYALYEDGYLTAYEVTGMSLAKTGLVVLSACETGLGDVQSGEGVWGLQRAFQLAGASMVMGSLWTINDDVTALFMKAFYRSYFNGGSARDAYIMAMSETRKTHAHPYYWGAFVLTE